MLSKRFALPATIRQLLSSGQEAGSKVQVHGWIKSVRRQKNVAFAVINDGSCASGLQAVLHNNQLKGCVLPQSPLLADNGVLLGWPTVRAFACLVHS